ncbi:MAG: BTAD domain-containing putative transcriptional regulator, partial [Ilumatobacteraceae bacterium]
MADAVRVSLLGPLEVRSDHGLQPVAGVKLQSLLSLLALATPQPVSDDRLIEELWGDDQPGHPANALQALASQLRRLLGRDVVARQGAGYVLRLDADLIDASRLERLVREAREAAARGEHGVAGETYRAAVELVRGPPLAELGDAWFARDAVTRLEELVLAAEEGLVDSELTMGRHADVLAHLVELVARHPLRERFRAQLIVALYRSGRQADALQAYRDARAYLLDELGLDPGPELQGLERSVLAHDPALAAPITLTPIAPAGPVVPSPLTSFVGRHVELATLADAVASSRLTSIVGPGGVGKTRLALELVRRLADRGEVWFVELAPVTQADEVAEAVASGIGAPEQAPADGRPAPSPEQRAVGRLGDRDAVVVLDNCEHLASAAATCALVLLAGCPGLRIVTTSREPLGIEGERQVVVGPLGADESAALFVERARAVQPMFTPADDGELVQLCQHLDGLPLAIELAAARAKTLPVPEIADRLRDRFQLLRRTQRAGTSRHEGLEAAIDWSYDLLFDEERRTFRRLAVFPGGVTIDAAERVCGPDAFELASRLVDRSLLVADTAGRSTRFTMLESLRAYGLQRLEDTGELAAARSEHLHWFVELAELVNLGSRGPDQLRWLSRLDQEHDNILVALAYAVEHEPEAALQLVGSVIMPWWFRGRRGETRRWIEASLAAGVDAAPELRARVLATGGLLAEPTSPTVLVDGAGGAIHDELALAEQRQREALGLYLAGDNALDTAFAKLLLLATMLRQATAGEPVDRTEAATLVADATAVFDQLGNDYGSALIRTTDAIMAIAHGEIDHAVVATDAASVYAQRNAERFSLSRISLVRGTIADLRGDARSAYRHVEHGLRLLDELGIHQAVTAQARMLAPLADRCGELELAAQWRVFVNDRGDGWTHYDGTIMASARNHGGLAARAAGDLDHAAEAHRLALEFYAPAGIPSGIAFSRSCLGFLAAERGDTEEAAQHH